MRLLQQGVYGFEHLTDPHPTAFGRKTVQGDARYVILPLRPITPRVNVGMYITTICTINCPRLATVADSGGGGNTAMLPSGLSVGRALTAGKEFCMADGHWAIYSTYHANVHVGIGVK